MRTFILSLIDFKLWFIIYGTILLVEDMALKVFAAKVSKEASEVTIHRHLKHRYVNDRGSNGQEFVEFLNDFKVKIPNGTHQ